MALPGLALVAGGLQAFGQVENGMAQGAAASYQAKVAANNAAIATGNAVRAAGAGSQQITNAGLKDRAQLGNVRAGLAANGLDVNSGSAATVQESQHATGYLDTETVGNNAALKVYGYENEATGYEGQSELDKSTAEYAPVAGAIGAATSLLSSAPNLGGKFSWMQGSGGSASTSDLFGGSQYTDVGAESGGQY